MAQKEFPGQDLVRWYVEHRRDFPWRRNRDPYRIWISEVMLQQTTTTAVVPFFEKFMDRFPNLTTLAESAIEDVLQTWAGLGYYRRAKLLHKSAQALRTAGGFPKHHDQLLQLPGFGPYTARAVASLAFAEPVAVVDGNVIRVASRWSGQRWSWWQSKVQGEIQRLVDQWFLQSAPDISPGDSADFNQAMMELGRMVCTPQRPHCEICPLKVDLPGKGARRHR
jgi:A/G-specific adenine glycosylase